MLEYQPIAKGLKFAEAPRWHDGALWFSDVHAYQLKKVTTDGIVSIVADVAGRPAGLGVLPDGRVLMATALDRKLWTVSSSGFVREVADLSALAEGVLNDMVVDGLGRAFVGDTGFNMGAGQVPRPGRVIHWREGESPRIVAENLLFPNGCVVTPDAQLLLIAETMSNRITGFAISLDGSLTNRMVFATLDSSPDGMCLDALGAVWIGQPHLSSFIRVTTDGRIARRVPSIAPFAVSCALGGSERRTLYMCSADTDLARLARGDSSARIDALEVDVPGAGWP